MLNYARLGRNGLGCNGLGRSNLSWVAAATNPGSGLMPDRRLVKPCGITDLAKFDPGSANANNNFRFFDSRRNVTAGLLPRRRGLKIVRPDHSQKWAEHLRRGRENLSHTKESFLAQF